MSSSKIIAGIITFLFFISLVYFIFPGVFNVTFPEFNLPSFKGAETPNTQLESGKRTSEQRKNIKHTPKIIDSYRGVDVFYNGKTSNVFGRNTTTDGYNIGLKYQCVEFVKRFYYEFYKHKMPNAYGHAKEFFDHSLSDGAFNASRGLRQFRNGSSSKPSSGAIIVFGAASFNQYGHVAIISKVGQDFVEIVQQNPGPNHSSRGEYKLSHDGSTWRIHDNHIVGWLSK